MTIIIFLFILSFVVLIHEFGHFIIAKKFGVRVHEFGIGFPPRLCKLFTWKETDFTLNLLPLGGFVAMDGEISDESMANDQDKTATEKHLLAGRFDRKKPWQKFLVILAGPIANFLLGALVFVILFGVEGIPVKQTGRVFIEYVEENSPAEAAQLQAQTEILTFESSQSGLVEINDTQTLIDLIAASAGTTVQLTTSGLCDDAGACQEISVPYTVALRLAADTPAGSGILGVSLSEYRTVFYPWYQQIFLSIYHGFTESLWSAGQLLSGLGQALGNLFSGQKSNLVVMGPVGIVSQLQQQHTFEDGFLAVLQFIGILSINLGVMNLLPIPALDGGRLVLIVLEKFIGRRKIAKVEIGLNYFGFIFLILLTIIITSKDIWRIFTQGG